MSGDAAAAMLRLRLLQYLARIRRDDCYGLLNDEVNPEDVPGYTDVVKHPMSWETMHKVRWTARDAVRAAVGGLSGGWPPTRQMAVIAERAPPPSGPRAGHGTAWKAWCACSSVAVLDVRRIGRWEGVGGDVPSPSGAYERAPSLGGDTWCAEASVNYTRT